MGFLGGNAVIIIFSCERRSVVVGVVVILRAMVDFRVPSFLVPIMSSRVTKTLLSVLTLPGTIVFHLQVISFRHSLLLWQNHLLPVASMYYYMQLEIHLPNLPNLLNHITFH